MSGASLKIVALGIGISACIGCVLGGTASPRAALAAWLAAYLFWLSIPLGALALVQIHDLSGGRWAVTLGASLEAALATLPFFAVAFVPVLASLPLIFPWARPDEAALLPNTFYLNVPFFIARFVLYSVVWNLFAYLAWRSSVLDGDGASGDGAMGGISALGLILLALTVTLASFDWIMSLEPHWSSSTFGMLVGSGAFIIALAFLTLVALLTPRASLPGEGALADRFHDLGSLLLAVILFWAYIAFMQLLIIWEENLKDEIGWYLNRTHGTWRTFASALVLLRFVLPFLALIWSPVKRSRFMLGVICGLLLFAGMLDVWWLTLPDLGGFSWLAPVAMLAMGGLWVALFGWRLERPATMRAPRRPPAVDSARGLSRG